MFVPSKYKLLPLSLLSLSYASKLDFSDYLTMMGITYSTKALEQVKSFNYTVVPKEFFISSPNGYCKEDEFGRLLDKTSLPIDGETTFPE